MSGINDDKENNDFMDRINESDLKCEWQVKVWLLLWISFTIKGWKWNLVMLDDTSLGLFVWMIFNETISLTKQETNGS